MELLSKAKLTLFSSLQTKKFRYKHQLVVIEGKKMVEEVLKSNWEVEALVYREDWSHSPLHSENILTYQASHAQFKRLSSQQHPEGILAISSFPQHAFQPIALDSFSSGSPSFLLWGIKDPGNMGTILRTADWLGFGQVLLAENCVDVLNPKVLRSSMGSIFRIPIYLAESLNPLSSMLHNRIWVADMSGAPAQEVSFQPSDILMIGGESHGIPASIRQNPVLKKVSIPKLGAGESLNAAISAAILGWQLKLSTTLS